MSNKRIRLVLVAHAVVAFAVVFSSSIIGKTLGYEVKTIALFGILMGQACLLGIWVGLSRNHIAQRLGGYVIGNIILTVFLMIGINDQSGVIPFLLVFGISGVIAITCGILGWKKIELMTLSQMEAGQSLEGLQFSITHLLAVMTFIGVLLGVAKALKHILDFGDHFSMLIIWGIFGFSFVCVALVTLWAGLGVARPVSRSALAFLFTIVMSFLPAFLFLDEGAITLIGIAAPFVVM